VDARSQGVEAVLVPLHQQVERKSLPSLRTLDEDLVGVHRAEYRGLIR
jgi:hypothetical protein